MVLRGKDDKKWGCQIRDTLAPCNLLMDEHQETHGKQFLRLEETVPGGLSGAISVSLLLGLKALLVP